MDIQQIVNVVDKINTDIYESCQYDEQFVGLGVNTNGYSIEVSFCGLYLWDSENFYWPDELAENEESLEGVLREELSKLLGVIYKVVV